MVGQKSGVPIHIFFLLNGTVTSVRETVEEVNYIISFGH